MNLNNWFLKLVKEFLDCRVIRYIPHRCSKSMNFHIGRYQYINIMFNQHAFCKECEILSNFLIPDINLKHVFWSFYKLLISIAVRYGP